MNKLREYKKRFLERHPDYYTEWRKAKNRGEKYSVKTYLKTYDPNYNRDYYLKNKEKIKLREKKYYSDHKEKYCLAREKYKELHPWIRTLHNARQRCHNQNNPKYEYYGGKGIKCFLTSPEIRSLWERDKASQMKQASIDRIDSKGNYTLENCRFIEMKENRKQTKAWTYTKSRPLKLKSECSKNYLLYRREKAKYFNLQTSP